MEYEQLKNPPLVEAILELRWRVAVPAQPTKVTPEVTQVTSGFPEPVDPSYDLLVGRLSDRLAGEYPFHERLPSAIVPGGMIPFLVQHRFRRNENEWPLVQIGPGVLTLNDTANYQWQDFLDRAVRLIGALFEVHPEKDRVVPQSMLLRYVDAEPFDYASANALSFLKEMLKIGFELPQSLFDEERVRSEPEGLNVQIGYPSLQPRGVAQLQVATGTWQGQKAFVWETKVVSREEDVPQLPVGARDWLEAAHALAHDWFFKLVEGKLLERYSGNE